MGSTNSTLKSVKGKNGVGGGPEEEGVKLGDTRACLQAKKTGGGIPEDTIENRQGYKTQHGGP